MFACGVSDLMLIYRVCLTGLMVGLVWVGVWVLRIASSLLFWMSFVLLCLVVFNSVGYGSYMVYVCV